MVPCSKGTIIGPTSTSIVQLSVLSVMYCVRQITKTMVSTNTFNWRLLDSAAGYLHWVSWQVRSLTPDQPHCVVICNRYKDFVHLFRTSSTQYFSVRGISSTLSVGSNITIFHCLTHTCNANKVWQIIRKVQFLWSADIR